MLIQKSKLLTGCLMVLIGLVNSSLADDDWDPGDDTSGGASELSLPSINIQTHEDHYIIGADPADWFKVTLTAGTTYLFDSTSDDGSDTYGELYDNPSGSPVAENDDDSEGGVFDFLIVYKPTISGPHYLKVRAYGDAHYSLRYKVAVDVWDPEDDIGAGAMLRVINEYVYVESPHSLTEADVNDWYRFSLTAGNTYRFETTGSWDTYGRLFSDSSGTTEVASDDQDGNADNFLIDYKPTISGDYFLQVAQTNNPVEYANYDLAYKLIEDEWDPVDDTGSGATVLSPIDATLRTHGPHALSNTDAGDWFKVVLVAGQTYRFESTGGSDTEGYLYADTAGTVELDYNDDFQPLIDSNFRMSYTATSSGNHYLRVNISAGQSAIYKLKYGIENDLDGDGMLDAWEISYFGNTNAQPTAHGDSDTQNNLEEYIAGTDPTNPASFFAVTNWSVGSFVVGWFPPSIEGREYNVLRAESLTNSFQQLNAVPIEHPQNSYTDTVHATESSGFYKVEVQLK